MIGEILFTILPWGREIRLNSRHSKTRGDFTANEQSEGGQWMEKYQKETSRVGGFLRNY